ncbi:MAG: hypothetical protein WBV39_15570 [Rudaea sp.]
MNRQEDILQQIVRIVQSGHDFFVDVYAGLTDAEIRSAFSYVIDVKSQFLIDLSPWASASDQLLEDPDSPTVAIERIYADARKNFHGNRLDASANELGFGEAQLLRVIERAYELADDIKLKRLFKAYYPQFVICREAMWRLSARLAA